MRVIIPDRRIAIHPGKYLVKLRLDSLAKIRTDSIRADSISKAKGDTTKVIKPR